MVAFYFFSQNLGNITVEKAYMCQWSKLTVVNSQVDSFSVFIIPYTYNHTNFHNFKIGTIVNLEFDILGKYIIKMNQLK